MANPIVLTDAGLGKERTLRVEGYPGGVLVTARDTAYGTDTELTVELAPHDEAALLDLLTARANVKRDAALRAMHARRYFTQGPAVEVSES